MNYIVVFILLVTCLSSSFSLKILVVFPPPARSHYRLGNELAKGLARAGHEVTMIASYSEKNPPKNYREIVIPEYLKLKKEQEDSMRGKFSMYNMANIPPVFSLGILNYFGNLMTTVLFENSQFQELLKSDEKFDVVVVEQFFNDAQKVIAWHFNAHLVLFTPVGSNRWVNNLVANPEPPSYVPDVFLSFTSDMNLYERIYNFVFGIISDLHLYWYFYPQQKAMVKKYFPDAPNFYDILYNVSLVLVNQHESIGEAVPHVPNMIDIGGFHVNPPKDLPKDLKEFMDNATEGVLYFSMGSNLIPSDMPKETKDAILQVLWSRKEKVLWKWDEDTLENKPDNMMISNWFPQQAILGHKNCKLFITHGGLLSTTETIYMGIPVLALPVLGDQKLNAARAVSLGYGKSIPFPQVNEYNFAEALNELLTNPRYGENAKLRSKIMHDRAIKPMDLANYWIEYVVRHNGASHLRVGGVLLPFYKYYMLDVIGAIFGGLLLVLYLLSKLCRLLCRRKSKSKLKKAKKE